uniref:Inosine-uridine preferring nucleoside hydrolase n=1 Tax=Solanum tuberosum TaxID=4113 RepID=M1A2Z3_SOLTU
MPLGRQRHSGGNATAGYCRYRQAIHVGPRRRLDIDSNFGFRKSFLPQCGDIGNLFTDYTSNPYAEFNFFMDHFAAYQVIHSGIPVTLVPLDATNTISVTEKFIEFF